MIVIMLNSKTSVSQGNMHLTHKTKLKINKLVSITKIKGALRKPLLYIIEFISI